MDQLMIWVFLNGIIWPTLGIIFTTWWAYQQGKHSRAIAEAKVEELRKEIMEELRNKVEELIKENVPTVDDIKEAVKSTIDYKIGGEATQMINAISQEPDFQQLEQAIPNLLDQNVGNMDPFKVFMNRLGNAVGKGLSNKLIKKADDWL